MYRLHRRVRFTINPPMAGRGPLPKGESRAPVGVPANNFAGAPAASGFARHYELEVACVGELDPVADYLVDIKAIDRAARASVVGALERACAMDASGNPAAALASSFPELSRLLGGRVRWARLWITPFFSLTVEGSAMDRVLVRQTFDFAASHRLHNPALSPEDNARLYGKCNNPRGHGHNYRVEPAFACPIDAAHAVDLAAIERVVDEVVIRRFDHKNLNEDTEEFATGRGANPSVENIARVVYELLGPEAPKIGRGVGLVGVTVWETDRTSATYPA